MKPISHCLNPQLLQICQKALMLDELNQKVRELLPENLRGHCVVGSFNKGALMLVVANPTLTTELRYLLPTLRDNLRNIKGLHQLTSINIKVMADLRVQ